MPSKQKHKRRMILPESFLKSLGLGLLLMIAMCLCAIRLLCKFYAPFFFSYFLVLCFDFIFLKA